MNTDTLVLLLIFRVRWVSLKSPTNRPTDHDQMHRPPTNQPPTSKKFEDPKKIEFIFDIISDFKYRVLKIMLCIKKYTH